MRWGERTAGLASLVAATPATGAELAEGPVLGTGEVLQVALGLGAILVFILVLAWVAKRLFNVSPGTHGQIRVLGGLAMGARDRIVLLQVGETQLLVGVSPGQMRTLHVLDEPLIAPAPRAVAEGTHGGGFTAQLARALNAAQRGRGND